ncbi:MAG: hypothetical protein R3E89_05080 [Thiolinea sp.]
MPAEERQQQMQAQLQALATGDGSIGVESRVRIRGRTTISRRDLRTLQAMALRRVPLNLGIGVYGLTGQYDDGRIMMPGLR